MAYLTRLRRQREEEIHLQVRDANKVEPGALLDMADAALNSWKEAHQVYNRFQRGKKVVNVDAFIHMRLLVHRELGALVRKTAFSYTIEAITYLLLLRWIAAEDPK